MEYLLVCAPLHADDPEDALETKVLDLLSEGWGCVGGPIVLHQGVCGSISSSRADINVRMALAQAMIKETVS